MKKALLVVDMQEVCVGEDHADFFQYGDSLMPAVNNVIDENKDNIIVYIRNIMKKGMINKFAPFQAYEGTKEIELEEHLHVISENIFDKYKGDAFSNEKLDEFLRANNVDEVEIIGVDGGGCVVLTALGASKAGYKVTVNTKAVGTMFKEKEKKFRNRLIGRGVKFV